MKIAFIGFGEAGQAFRRSLAEAVPGADFAAYDILFDEQSMDGPLAAKARAANVTAAATAGEAAAAADIVISAVTAASSLEAGRSVAARMGQGQVFIDINSVSPGRKQETAPLFAQGVHYIDMAVMAPVHPLAHRSATLVAADVPEATLDALRGLDFRFEFVGREVGTATGIKMIRSVFMKGLEAITVEAILAAEKAGCVDRVVGSLARQWPGLNWPDFAFYELERTLTHGVRRAAEMRESGKTLDELGFEGDLPRAIAAVQDRMGAMKSSLDAPRFEKLVEEIRRHSAPAATADKAGTGRA